MTILGYGVKRRVCDALAMETSPGRVLDGVQVEYAWPGEKAKEVCVYFGGIRETQTDDASASAMEVLKYCVANISLYLRVQRDAAENDVRTVEAEVESIGDIIGAWLSRNPEAGGKGSRSSVSFAAGDYSQDNQTVVAIAAYNIECRGYMQP